MEVRSSKGCCGLPTNVLVLVQLQEERIRPIPPYFSGVSSVSLGACALGCSQGKERINYILAPVIYSKLYKHC